MYRNDLFNLETEPLHVIVELNHEGKTAGLVPGIGRRIVGIGLDQDLFLRKIDHQQTGVV